MGTLQGSWIWYELMSPDPDGSKVFYEAVVGWSMTTGHSEDTHYGFIACPDCGMTGGLMRLNAEMQQHGARPSWIGYLGVDDVDASVAAITAAGGQCHLPPFDIDLAGRVAMVTDCCGAPFYVMTPKAPPGGGQSTAFSAQPHPGRCGWNELMAGNAANATAFYTAQFGWTLPDAMDMGPMGKYQFIAHDCVMLGAIMGKPDAVAAPAWNHYFWIDSAAAAVERITAAGGQVVNGPQEVPGPLWTVQGIDPQGAMFALVGGK